MLQGFLVKSTAFIRLDLNDLHLHSLARKFLVLFEITCSLLSIDQHGRWNQQANCVFS